MRASLLFWDHVSNRTIKLKNLVNNVVHSSRSNFTTLAIFVSPKFDKKKVIWKKFPRKWFHIKLRTDFFIYHKNVFANIVVQLRLLKIKGNCDQRSVLFSREPFKDNIPMGNSQSRGMMFILTRKFLFLNMSREKWFNEPITSTTTERRFKCFPKLIQTQITKSETFRSVSEEIICEEDDEASCVEDWERVREDQKSWEWNSFDRRLLFQLEKMWEIINFHVHHHTIRCRWLGEIEIRSCKLIMLISTLTVKFTTLKWKIIRWT